MDLDGDGIDEEQLGGQLDYHPLLADQAVGYGGFQQPQGLRAISRNMPPGFWAAQNRMHAPAPPRPGMPGPIGPPDAMGQPDPRIMQQVQEKEQAIQMIDQRDDVAPWQKEHAKMLLRGAIQKIDPHGHYQQGSPFRTQSQIEKQFGQGVMQDPRHPDLFWHLDPRGVPKPFQYKQPNAPPPPIDFHGHLQQHTGMGLQDWLALGVAPHIDPKGAVHFHNLPQMKQQKDLEREAFNKRYMEHYKHRTEETTDANGKTTFKYPDHDKIMESLDAEDRAFKEYQDNKRMEEWGHESLPGSPATDNDKSTPEDLEVLKQAKAALRRGDRETFDTLAVREGFRQAMQKQRGTPAGATPQAPKPPQTHDELAALLPGGNNEQVQREEKQRRKEEEESQMRRLQDATTWGGV